LLGIAGGAVPKLSQKCEDIAIRIATWSRIGRAPLAQKTIGLPRMTMHRARVIDRHWFPAVTTEEKKTDSLEDRLDQFIEKAAEFGITVERPFDPDDSEEMWTISFDTDDGWLQAQEIADRFELELT
jgi:hypothetical protein